MLLKIGQTLLLALLLLMFSSCSSSEEDESKGAIEQTTDKIAQEAVARIKDPLDQAKLARELTEAHNQATEEAAKQQ